jgi:hypothetical protein
MFKKKKSFSPDSKDTDSHPKRVLYVFSSLTKLKKEFQVDLSTLKPDINSEGIYYLGLFFLLLVYLVDVI